MGRYPFLETGKRYLGRRKPFLAKSTFDDLERKNRYLNEVFVQLKKDGKVSTTNPEKFTVEDIGSFREFMRSESAEKGWTKGTKRKKASQNYLVGVLRFVKELCEFSGNDVFTELKANGEDLFEKVPKDLKPLSDRELAAIRKAAESMEGWTGEVARFIVAMYPYTGLRASELRLAHFEDLDIEKWTIWVRHPKGEAKYARQRTAPILPPARAAVLRFIEARRNWLKAHGVDRTEALIPVWWDGKFKFYEATQFRTIKKEIETIATENGTPIRFHLKTFRDTYCQQNIDRNPGNLSAVSVTMGHATSRTTETSYGRIRMDRALEDLQREWESDASPKVQFRRIESKFDITGYH
jgi:integrase